MDIKNLDLRLKKIYILLSFFSLTNFVFSQNTIINGKVVESKSGEPIEYASVRLDGTTIGTLTNEKGQFRLTNKGNENQIIVALMGYVTKRISVKAGETSNIVVKLESEGVQLSEVIVNPEKQKYSKKNNPAVELIKKVIANKYKNTIVNQSYYMDEEYDRTLFAVNEYEKDKGLLKNMKFLSKYADTSLIDNKPILPFSVRETVSNVYYRKNPKGTRRVVTAYNNEGLDQSFDTEPIDAVIKEVLQEVNITNNNIELLFHNFVSPLSSTSSVNFYKWYIIDTLEINNKKYIDLGFVPFNTRDVGFTGNLLIRADSSYAVKQVSFRVPAKSNVNFVKELFITQEFQELKPNLWIPQKYTMAMDLTMYNVANFYVQKEQVFSNFLFDLPVDAVFQNPSPVIYLTDYNKHNSDFWNKQRPDGLNKDYNMDAMIAEFRSNKLINFTMNATNILMTGYIPINKDEEKNKLDLGTPLTFYSYNLLEGNRIRLTAATTRNFNKNLYLYGYVAYGTKDEKFKYYGEATWAFNNRKYHKDEFPRNNLSIGYKYDVNTLGQQFLQAERDNIFMSLRPREYNNLTYSKSFEISYFKENYNGFSNRLYARTSNQQAAGKLKLETKDAEGFVTAHSHFKTTEVGLELRYAPTEKFMQNRRKRVALPSQSPIITLSHKIGFKGILGGQNSYSKSSLGISKDFWIAPFGRLYTNLQADKVWTRAPFPVLLSANANSSATIQKGTFNLLRPLEFINDSQLVFDVNYRMGGWLFNRVPLLKALKWREVFGFKSLWGHLSKKNNPNINHSQLVFPENSYAMGSAPYMEYSIGVENIFQFFRIDYVKRINYLDNADIDKHGFRISFEVNF